MYGFRTIICALQSVSGLSDYSTNTYTLLTSISIPVKQVMLTIHHASKSFPRSWLDSLQKLFLQVYVGTATGRKIFSAQNASENVFFITPTELPERMEGKQAASSRGKEGLVNLPAPCYQAVTSWCNPAQP